jgi:ATP-dependent Clp protease ATP-binding subunit ClpA
MDGESELYRVGRCLNHQYPHDLDRVLLRDREVAELSRLLKASDRRPVLLLGNRQSGKTAILHEYVFRHVTKVGNPHRDKEAVWLLSPQRLISGMSYVGQWESRFHAIIKHASARELTLYFDDPLGLFQAGVTSQSILNVAALLRTVLEQRSVRIVGEMTPEEFRVLREKDRSFADQFHVIRVEELTGDDNLKVLFGLQRQLELRHQVRFSIDALPVVVDLQRRYARDVAFPGKAAVFMKRLAVRAEGETNVVSDTRIARIARIVDHATDAPGQISRHRVLDVFHQQTGLPRSFLDQQTTLCAEEIEKSLRARFVGQPDAVKAAVDIVSIARARLNDPTRPVASLLLLGPTGVGKTEFAKSLASYLFGNSDRLLRFDMNEYVSPNAVPQLVGTFAQPEGLLTAAVRRQPFAVLLFDEIEKGHPDVFDLLLQVLGEGRLTDARGRTTDFSNTIIVLTSNLGTQRTESGLGFGGVSSQGASTAIRAAENFFRPEFFNRLDRVIPFDRLSRDDMQIIARHLMADVLQRDGLVRRQCVLNTTPQAIDWVIDQGYNPVLGARALKRAIEKELTRPIAEFLAEQGTASGERQGVSEMNSITLIDVDRVASRLSVSIRSLAACPAFVVARTETDSDVEAVLTSCDQILRTLDERLSGLKPAGTFQAGRLSPAQSRYLLVQDETRRLKQWHEEIRLALAARKHAASGTVVSRPGRTAKGLVIRRKGPSHGNQVGRDAADDEIDDFVETRFAGPPRDVNLHDEPMDLIARCRWVHRVATIELSRVDETVQLRISCLDLAGLRFMEPYIERLREAWSDELGLETELHDDFEDARTRGLSVRGMLARDYAEQEIGYHMTEPEFAITPSLFCVHEALAAPRDMIVRPMFFQDHSVSRLKLVWPMVETLRRLAWEKMDVP